MNKVLKDVGHTANLAYFFLLLLSLSAQAGRELYFLHNDHLGTPRVITDKNQQVMWKGHARPFGDTDMSTNRPTPDSAPRNLMRVTMGVAPVALISISCSSGNSKEPQPGCQYKILTPIYLMAVYDDVDNKQLSKETARAYLNPQKYATRYFTAFQKEVPAGTIMTILDVAPKTWNIPSFANSYFVRLDPDLSQGLSVELKLDRGMEGNLDGLNPDIFVLKQK